MEEQERERSLAPETLEMSLKQLYFFVLQKANLNLNDLQLKKPKLFQLNLTIYRLSSKPVR